MSGCINKMINGLNENQLKELKAVLLARRDELRRSMLERSRIPRVEANHNIKHLDFAAAVKHHAVAVRAMDKESKLLKRIERALFKIGNGQYGLCEATNEAIGYPRLKVVPWTRYSMDYID